MDRSAFAEFVAAVWRRQGWQTQVTTKSDRTFVALQRDGAEGLIWATPAAAGDVSEEALRRFVTICEQYGLNEGAVVTSGRFTDDAERIAARTGIQLVDGEKLRTIVEARDLHDLVRKHADADGTTGSDDGDESQDEDGRTLPVPPKLAAAVVVAVVAVVLGPTILGTGGQVEERDGEFAVTAESTNLTNASDGLRVEWNANTVSKIDTDPDDDAAYRPRDGEQFAFVTMRVTNEGNGTTGVQPSDFVLRSNGTLRGHQPLNGTRGFEPTLLEPGNSTSVWMVFSIDADATGATLLVSDRATRGGLDVRFVRDSELATEP